jgi:hypothetical protein
VYEPSGIFNQRKGQPILHHVETLTAATHVHRNFIWWPLTKIDGGMEELNFAR